MHGEVGQANTEGETMNRALTLPMFVVFTHAVAFPVHAGHNVQPAKALEGLEAKVDAYLAPYLASRDFSGAILVARGDNVLLRKAYGMANYEVGASNTGDTRFRIASLTKTFTAAAIVMLKERGLLSFDDHLDKFLPDYPNAEKIKIQHLLAHSAGIANPDYPDIFFKNLTLDELIDSFKNKPLEFEPGSRGQYSSAGYVLLARIVEKASGQPYDDFLRENIFEPLKMSHTGSFGQAGMVHKRASGYVAGPGPTALENAPVMSTSALVGSGSLYSTVDDLYRWAKAVRSDKLFKRSTLKYPFGWGKRSQNGHNYISQSGLIPGFMSHLIVFLDQPVYVICLSNIESGLFNRLEKDLTSLALGQEPDKRQVERPTPAEIDPRLLEGCVGRYQGPGLMLRVILDDGHLYSKFDDGPVRSFLVPTSNDELYMRSGFAKIRVTRNEKGEAAELSLLWGSGGEPMKFTRVTPTVTPQG
jgi:CubicO group peptidase (beta-lactamase class C family)